MAGEQRRLRNTIRAVLGAYVVGLAGVIGGVAIWNSRGLVGISMVWLTAVVIYAWQTFRCPLCGVSIFNSPFGGALRWLFRTPRRCPRCRADYEVALAELKGSKPSSRR